MQKNRSILDSFPETINLTQGSVSHDASGDLTAPWDNLLNPVEDRLTNSMLSSARENLRHANGTSYKTQNCSAWDQGESSSSANLHGIGRASHLKIGHGWPSSPSNHVLTNPKSEERRFGPSNVLHPESSTSGYGGSHLIPNLSSAHSPVNANLSSISNNGDTRLVMRPSVSSTVYTSCSRLDAEHPSGVSYNAGILQVVLVIGQGPLIHQVLPWVRGFFPASARSLKAVLGSLVVEVQAPMHNLRTLYRTIVQANMMLPAA